MSQSKLIERAVTYRSRTLALPLIIHVEALCSDGSDEMSPFVLLVLIGEMSSESDVP